MAERLKHDVQAFWERGSCGEVYLQESAAYERQAEIRYVMEPYIPAFAGFDHCRGVRILEIGVGLGADHERFARGGADLFGMDMTGRAVAHVKRRLGDAGLTPRLLQGDAERLPFADGSFDIVYAWGVLHHSPDTPRAVREAWRVLRPGGELRMMVYHTWSLVGFMLWMRYGLLRCRPFRSLRDIYGSHLESPGTKAYTIRELHGLMEGFRGIECRIELSGGDLLMGATGQRHRGPLLSLARRFWPRWFIRRVLPAFGLFLLARGVKSV